MNDKNWSRLDTVVGLISGICGIVGIFTSIRSAAYNEQEQLRKIGEYYGLECKEEKES